MLTAIREFFERHIGAPSDTPDAPHRIEVATAAVLVEVARNDGGVSAVEREAILRAVRGKFSLSAEEAETLVTLAEAEVGDANDYFQFTSLINRTFSAEQKARVIEKMWAAAYADGELSAHENHVMRRIADLLHIPHATYIDAKMRARDAASGKPV